MKAPVRFVIPVLVILALSSCGTRVRVSSVGKDTTVSSTSVPPAAQSPSSATPAEARAATPASTPKTDAQIRQELIKASIANYSGSCPCPFNVDRAGGSCGARSAYSRPGGASPLCYDTDVSQKMVDDY